MSDKTITYPGSLRSLRNIAEQCHNWDRSWPSLKHWPEILHEPDDPVVVLAKLLKQDGLLTTIRGFRAVSTGSVLKAARRYNYWGVTSYILSPISLSPISIGIMQKVHRTGGKERRTLEGAIEDAERRAEKEGGILLQEDWWRPGNHRLNYQEAEWLVCEAFGEACHSFISRTWPFLQVFSPDCAPLFQCMYCDLCRRWDYPQPLYTHAAVHAAEAANIELIHGAVCT